MLKFTIYALIYIFHRRTSDWEYAKRRHNLERLATVTPQK